MILFRQKVAIPDFLEAQRKSFRLFLETGIRRELEFITSMDGDPVSDKSNPLQDEYVSGVFLANKFYFKRPVCTPQEAIVQMETYQSTLVVPLYLVSKTSGLSGVIDISLCDLPLMTEHGTFIINGSPRVIVHQIVRCPGVYIKAQFDQKNRRSHLVSFLSSYGSWLRLETVPNNPEIYACINNLRKLPVTLLLCALGFDFKRVCTSVSYPNTLVFTELLLQPKSTEQAMVMMTALMFPHRAGSVLKAKKFLFTHFFHARR
jgi:DNA-directed RNA polymerase subunit beta